MYYFIGIKGTGMASLALMLNDLGEEVCGSDLDKHFFTQDELEKKNIKIFNFDPNNIKDNYTVIIGNAFLEDFPEVIAARNNPTCKCYRYHEFLGELMKNYISLTVSGSHGKTTTTTMLKSVVSHFDKCGYLIGDGQGYLDKDSKYLCVEADEFERHFISYYPSIAIITNIEIDHVDYFKDENDYFDAYQEFVGHVKEAVFYYGDDAWCKKLKFNGVKAFSFGFEDNNDYVAKNIVTTNLHTNYDLYYKNELIGHFDLPFIGKHLIIDSLGVIAEAHYLGYDLKEVNKVFENNYEGPKRRYKIEEVNNTIFVDDYAHHPTEVKVTIEASKTRYPGRKVIAIFKPHRASRVKYFLEDFKNALSLADQTYLLDFTSIDDTQDGTTISIHDLEKLIPNSKVISEDENGAKILSKYKGECLLFMSSKDIYNLANLTKEKMK